MSESRLDPVLPYLSHPPAPLGKGGRAALWSLCALTVLGLGAWINQLVRGLGETGMQNSTTWGLYITNFVFFIGISHAGTLISAILRITGAEWRRPITRIAEAVTVFALIVAGFQVVVDLGRPDRTINLLLSGKLASPLMWDVLCISVYLLSCIFYLSLPLIPDLGRLSRSPGLSARRRRLYRLLALGWLDSPGQRCRLERAIGVMAVAIIPIMVSVHTVVSWVFGMTLRPMWHSTIFGPYFVTGAIFSGIAVVVLALAAVRRYLHLEPHLTPVHFDRLGTLLVVMCCLWFYFTVSELLTTGYGGITGESAVLDSKIRGEFMVLFWMMVACMAMAFIILLLRRRAVVSSTVVASILIVLGMWLERFTIIVPTLTRAAEEGYRAGLYRPTATEWIITAGSVAAFLLLYVGFLRLFPAVSIWEMRTVTAPVDSTERSGGSALPGAEAGRGESPHGALP